MITTPTSSYIRNVTLLAAVDHGKSTLTDTLVNAAHKVNTKCRTGEREMDGIFRYPAVVSSLMFPYKEQEYLINVVHPMSHVDFSLEDTSRSFQTSDGALIVVDCVEGSCYQIEARIQQALKNRIVPVLMINKIDRAILELQLETEELYQSILRIVDYANDIISTHTDHSLGYRFALDPLKGNVAIGSGKMGWAFTIGQFAKLYARKFKMDEEAIRKKLWGEWYYCSDSKKWQKDQVSKSTGKRLKRGFCRFVLEPIFQLFRVAIDRDMTKLDSTLTALDIHLTISEKGLPTKDLLNNVMRQFLPLHEALVELFVERLPSPDTAQKYRYPLLYKGPLDDQYATAIRYCDDDGPLMVYIANMIPEIDGQKFISIGRVFSGTLKVGQTVRIMGPQYDASALSDTDTYETSIQRLLLITGKQVDIVHSGNWIGIVGLGNTMVATSTVTDVKCSDASRI